MWTNLSFYNVCSIFLWLALFVQKCPVLWVNVLGKFHCIMTWFTWCIDLTLMMSTVDVLFTHYVCLLVSIGLPNTPRLKLSIRQIQCHGAAVFCLGHFSWCLFTLLNETMPCPFPWCRGSPYYVLLVCFVRPSLCCRSSFGTQEQSKWVWKTKTGSKHVDILGLIRILKSNYKRYSFHKHFSSSTAVPKKLL